MRLFQPITYLFFVLAACTNGGFGSDWYYSSGKDSISGEPFSVAVLLLGARDYSDQPDSVVALCSSNKFELYISSEGYWGSGSRLFRANQVFELRIDEEIFSGKYLPDVNGDSAWLLSASPRFQAVNQTAILRSLIGAKYIAARVSDYRGAPSTSSTNLSGNSDGLLQVVSDCGIASP